MNRKLRDEFNKSFAKNNSIMKYLSVFVGEEITTPLARMPVYVPQAFIEQMNECSQQVIQSIKDGSLVEASKKFIPQHLSIKEVTEKPSFISIDYAVAESANGSLEPRLIELQGFPSVFGYLLTSGEYYEGQLGIELSKEWTFPGVSKYDAFFALRRTILGSHSPENVVLVDHLPWQQHTAFDFKLTRALFGIETICLSEIKIHNEQLYYLKAEEKISIKRIYNRTIFTDLGEKSADFIELLNQAKVEWAAHPDWYFLLSKTALPLIESRFNPACSYLQDIDFSSLNLAEYVLKPLFDYCGKGVDIYPQLEKLQQITDPANYILQKKIKYANCVLNPDGGTALKTELRVLYTWPDDMQDPVPVCMLARLTDGETMSVRTNKGSQWMGGTVALSIKN